MKLFYTVFMNQRDVTSWISSLEVRQPRGAIYRQFDLAFAGWNAIEGYETGARWDIFASHDENDPQAEIVVRAGVVPPDRERHVVVARGRVPTLTVRGYDNVWLMQRRRPNDTIVAVPDSGIVADQVGEFEIVRRSTAEDAIAKHNGPVGRYRVWQYMRRLRNLVERLGAAAGVRIDYRLPDHELSSTIIPATSSYWEAIRDLVKPWAPDFYFRRSLNTLTILDPESPRYVLGRRLDLSTKNVERLDSRAVTTNRIRRVIVRFP